MFKASPLFGDHAILPLGKELRIFGTADEGEVVRASLTAADGSVTGEGQSTARDGRFLIHLPPQKMSDGPFNLTLTSDSGTFTASDLCVGYVFMAGGQSNMEWSLWNAEGGQEIIKTHDDPDLRYFNVPRVSVLDEKGQAAHDAARWTKIAPHTGGDMSGVGYFFARKLRRETGLPVGVVGCNWGGTSILSWMDETALNASTLAERNVRDYEEAYCVNMTVAEWQEREEKFETTLNAWNAQVEEIKAAHPGIEWAEIEKEAGPCPWNPPPGPGSPYRPGQLAKTMVEKIVPMALSGILFYQGESDVDRATEYGNLLIALVTRWRELFGDAELPFYNVQLPMFIDAGVQDDHRWAILRQQQEKAWHALRNSCLAVMIDAGEYGNIHPVDKVTPGERLAQLFLGPDETPRAMGKSTSGYTLTVNVSHPVEARDGEPDLFEVAGEDGVYHPARAELDWNKIHLTAEGVAHPVRARYAWVNYAKVHVFGVAAPHLPLAPFVLDN